MEFNNRRYFQKQRFELLGKTLKIHKKGMFDEIEYEIPLDSIHNKKTIQTLIDNNFVVIGIFFFVFSLVLLFITSEDFFIIFIVAGLLFISLAFLNRKRMVTIPTFTEDPIVMYYNRNTKTAVVNYADEIIAASDKYLLNKYIKIDRALPVEPQIEHLKFLLNRDILSEEDFESLKNKLLGRDGKSSIDFSQ